MTLKFDENSFRRKIFLPKTIEILIKNVDKKFVGTREDIYLFLRSYLQNRTKIGAKVLLGAKVQWEEKMKTFESSMVTLQKRNTELVAEKAKYEKAIFALKPGILKKSYKFAGKSLEMVLKSR